MLSFPLRTTAFLLVGLGPLLLAAPGCARRTRPAPVVEAVRTPDSPTPTGAARDLADVMTTTLSLRPEQTLKVRQILNATVDQVNQARQRFPAKSPQLTAELKRINASSESDLRQALGPATYREYQSKKRQLQAEMQQRQGQ